MNRSAILLAAGIFCAGSVPTMAQTRATNATNTPAPASTQTQGKEAIPAGAPIEATLEKSLDSKKAKPGEPISARVTQNTEANGKILVPEGAKLEGHVTEASARAKGAANSSLGMVFDKVVLKDGATIPVNITMQAMALPQSEATAQNGSSMDTVSSTPSSGMGRGAMTTQPQTTPAPTPGSYGATTGSSNPSAITGGPGAVGGLNAQGQLTANSKGVFGLPGIELTSGTQASQQSAMISASGKNVHLDGGTQMLLLTQAVNPSEKPKS